MVNSTKAYQHAQSALTDLKVAIHLLLIENSNGLTNAHIGRSLGIYYGHGGQHEGHIPRVVLDMMKAEGVVEQDAKTKKWRIKIEK